MFYFLLSNSSITKIKEPEKKLLTTFLYGSILYIIFHAILNTSSKPFFQIIKTYYWTILALDIFTLLFYYKDTFINLITKDGVVKKMITTLGNTLQNIFNNIADTSNYSNEVDFETNNTLVNGNDTFDDVQCTLDNLKQKTKELENLKNIQFNNEDNTNSFNDSNFNNNTIQDNKSILKKVSFNDNENTSHIIPNEIKELNNDLQKLNQHNKPQLNTHQPNTQETNNNNSSSIQEIRKKQNINKSNLQSYDNNTLIENRNELSNDELENIKLNYNPNDLLNEIEYETEQKNELLNGNDFLIGNGNSKLDNNDINTIKSTPISQIKKNKNLNQNTTNKNNNLKNNSISEDDKQSQISSISDLGSVFDFNLDDFENKL